MRLKTCNYCGKLWDGDNTKPCPACKTIPFHLRDYLKKTDSSYEDIAEELSRQYEKKISRQNIYMWLTGTVPSTENFFVLCDFFRLDPLAEMKKMKISLLAKEATNGMDK